MSTLTSLLKERAKHEQAARDLTEQIHEAKSRTMLKCGGCGKRTRIDKLTYRKLYWYERPYGCTGGDNWHEDRECQWDCPKCNHRNRCYTHERDENGRYKKHPVWYLERYFGEVQKVYDRN